ncbi:hypothetical protein F7725_024654 [Dissostichus mawsoni]|uniref:C2H2-type domain-containing protein n=1 Tax=Dissostichus mawsoni TaxID=36200 RepID=A0A7J5X8X3_DISMA|nr:hypothetical protein F7725_024654 [Dissostichus mawsoni]
MSELHSMSLASSFRVSGSERGHRGSLDMVKLLTECQHVLSVSGSCSVLSESSRDVAVKLCRGTHSMYFSKSRGTHIMYFSKSRGTHSMYFSTHIMYFSKSRGTHSMYFSKSRGTHIMYFSKSRGTPACTLVRVEVLTSCTLVRVEVLTACTLPHMLLDYLQRNTAVYIAQGQLWRMRRGSNVIVTRAFCGEEGQETLKNQWQRPERHPNEYDYMWKCKDCAAEETSRFQLLKHYRLKHGHFGRRHPYQDTLKTG